MSSALTCTDNVRTSGYVKRRKPKAQRKEATIQIRLTVEQKRSLVDAAEKAGLDVSSWLRTLGLQAAGQKPG
jgi:uncharacterized protein (DUF1778 family)